MCAGVDGPGEPCEGAGTYSKTCFKCRQLLWNCKCSKERSKPVKQRKVPYNDYRGTVIASYKTNRTSVELYKCKEGNNFTVSWRGVLSSGAATYTVKSNAVSEYNGKVPDKFKII